MSSFKLGKISQLQRMAEREKCSVSVCVYYPLDLTDSEHFYYHYYYLIFFFFFTNISLFTSPWFQDLHADPIIHRNQMLYAILWLQ